MRVFSGVSGGGGNCAIWRVPCILGIGVRPLEKRAVRWGTSAPTPQRKRREKVATPHLGLFILWSFHGGTGLSVLFSFIVLVCSGVGWARERSRQEASLQDAALLAAGLAWLVHRSADGVIEDLFQALLRESGAFQVSGGSDFLRH